MKKVYEVDVRSVHYSESTQLHVLAATLKDAATKGLNIAKRRNLVSGTPVVSKVEHLCDLDN